MSTEISIDPILVNPDAPVALAATVGTDESFSAVLANTGTQRIDGGDGTDSLSISATGVTGGLTLRGTSGGAAWSFGSAGYYDDIKAVLSTATGDLTVGVSGQTGAVSFANMENLSVTGGVSNDLILSRGTGTVNGGAGTDTLYADWSAATGAIVWDNLASATAQTVNGVTISNIERLQIETGSGHDAITNTRVSTDDYINTGAGNDTITLASTGTEFDDIWGGTGTDTLVLDASARGGVFWTVFNGAQERSYDQGILAKSIGSWITATSDFQLASGSAGIANIYGIENLSLTDRKSVV